MSNKSEWFSNTDVRNATVTVLEPKVCEESVELSSWYRQKQSEVLGEASVLAQVSFPYPFLA